MTKLSPPHLYRALDKRVDITVQTLAARNDIQTYRRRWGMVVAVYDDGANNGLYVLEKHNDNRADNTNWRKKHDRLHDIDSEDDHAPATGDDKGKWIRANPDTGAIEYTDAPKQDAHKTYLIDHDNHITVQHNMGKLPGVTVVTTDGDEMLLMVIHTDENNLTVTWEPEYNTLQGTLILN